MNIQNIKSVIVENLYIPYDIYQDYVYFLEETPEEVKKVIKKEDSKDGLEIITRNVYSFEDYVEKQRRKLTDFV